MTIIDFKSSMYLEKSMDKIIKKYKINKVITASYSGVNKIVKNYVKDKDLIFEEFMINVDKYGTSAEIALNITISEQCDLLVVYWDGINKNIMHLIDLCKSKNIEIIDNIINIRKKRNW